MAPSNRSSSAEKLAAAMSATCSATARIRRCLRTTLFTAVHPLLDVGVDARAESVDGSAAPGERRGRGEDAFQLVADVLDLVLGHHARERQRERRVSERLGNRKIAAAVAEAFRVERLQVDRREVGPRRNAAL